MLGAAGVGKSSLVGQFMTSEYLHAYDTSIGTFLFIIKEFVQFCIAQTCFTRVRVDTGCQIPWKKFKNVFPPEETRVKAAKDHSLVVCAFRVVRGDFSVGI